MLHAPFVIRCADSSICFAACVHRDRLVLVIALLALSVVVSLNPVLRAEAAACQHKSIGARSCPSAG